MSNQPDDQQAAVARQKVIGDKTVAPLAKDAQRQDRAADDFRRDKTGRQPSMHVRVYSPFQIYYDDQAFSISANNATGPFDILPHHHNFIALLSASDLVIRGLRSEDKRISISGGLMHVKADEVIVFLDV